MKLWQKVLIGALTGAAGALTADTHAASQSAQPWDWKLALKRVGAGAITGATAAAGLGSLTQ